MSRVLFCTLLIERSHQRQLTLKAALEYNAVLAPRLTSASRDEPFTWQKIARLEGCPGQVDRVPRQGGLLCLACKRFNAFSIETYEKLALPAPCKQAKKLPKLFGSKTVSLLAQYSLSEFPFQ